MLTDTELKRLMYKRSALLYYLLRHRNQQITRADLQSVTSASQPAVTLWLKSLISAGLVHEAILSNGASVMGRPRVQVSIVPEAAWVGALYVTTSSAEVGLANIAGKIVESTALRWDLVDISRNQGLLQFLISKLKEWVAARGIPPERMLGLGVATSGPIDSSGVVFSYSWKDNGYRRTEIPLRNMLAAVSSLPVQMDTNARAIAMGERWFGTGYNNFILLHVSSGIAVGTVMNGQLIRSTGLAGELLPVDVVLQKEDSPLYGRSCQITDIVSRRAIMERIPVEKGISTLTQVVEAARQGDNVVLEVLEECAEAISLVISPIVNTLDPEAVILSGPIFEVPQVIDYIRQYVKAHSFSAIMEGRSPAVLPASFPKNAGLVGAASLVYDEICHHGEAPSSISSF